MKGFVRTALQWRAVLPAPRVRKAEFGIVKRSLAIHVPAVDIMNSSSATNTSSASLSSSPPQRRPFTIVVEGNIGSGKTTFLAHFLDREDVQVVAEPVDRWRNVQGHNLLQLMYSDPKRWSLLFQTYVQLTMLQQHTAPCQRSFRIMERSLARYCFVENLYSKGLMADCEYAVLSEWFNYLMTCPQLDLGVDLLVYLRTSPDVAFDRVCRRNRGEEHAISREYIQQLHELHEDWLVRKTKFQPLSAPVVVVDANEDLSTLTPKYAVVKEEILRKAG